MPCFARSVCAMPHEPRHLTYLGREGRFKHYGIGTHAPDPRPALVDAVRALVPAGETGFTIAHDARSAGLGLVYWWANENELHRAAYVAPAGRRQARWSHSSTRASPASGSSRSSTSSAAPGSTTS